MARRRSSARPMSRQVADFWLGTDKIGRDLLSRLIYGARNTIVIALVTTLLSFLIGGTLGVFAALTRGWLDQGCRASSILDGDPVADLGAGGAVGLRQSIVMLILIMALLDSTRVFRLSRAVAVDITVMDYVEAARLRGEGTGWIIFREILPNALSPLVAEFGLRFIFVVLFHLDPVLPRPRRPAADGRLGRHGGGEQGRSSSSASGPSPIFPRPSIPPLRSRSWRSRSTSWPTGCCTSQADLAMSLRGSAARARPFSTSATSGSRATATARLAADRQGRGRHAEARRGAGPDRRIRRRQVDHRPVRHGLRRGGCRITGGTILLNGRDIRERGEEELRKLRGRASPMSRNRRRPPSTRRTG